MEQILGDDVYFSAMDLNKETLKGGGCPSNLYVTKEPRGLPSSCRWLHWRNYRTSLLVLP